MFIPQIEEAGNFLYLIRPRRFGKSIFLGMLSAYYDVEGKEDFPSLFKDTWIEQHPTSLQSRYQVLFLIIRLLHRARVRSMITSMPTPVLCSMSLSRNMRSIMMKIRLRR